ncbi:MAG TPA: dihydrofolate reductase family protein [Acidobacteriaceae bacterium]|nr:dihydrofolate reductase family protein [Acidobacteriaceae bacterium]
MRLVRFSAAVSLDGFIAGPKGESDWIVHDPDVDFSAMMAEFDTFLIGRKTFELMVKAKRDQPPKGVEYVVFSRTLRAAEFPRVRIESDPGSVVGDLRSRRGKDLWLFGGGELLGSFLAAGLVDRIEVSVIAALLGAGIPMVPAKAGPTKLKLLGHRVYPKTGTLRMEYEVVRTE